MKKQKRFILFALIAMLGLSSCQFLPNMPFPGGGGFLPNQDKTTNMYDDDSLYDEDSLYGTSDDNINPESYEYYQSHYNYVGTRTEFYRDKRNGNLSHEPYHSIVIKKFTSSARPNTPEFFADARSNDSYETIQYLRTYDNGETVDFRSYLSDYKAVFEDLYNYAENDDMPMGIDPYDYRAHKSCDLVIYCVPEFSLLVNIPHKIKPGIQYNFSISLWNNKINQSIPLNDDDYFALNYSIDKCYDYFTINFAEHTFSVSVECSFHLSFMLRGMYKSSSILITSSEDGFYRYTGNNQISVGTYSPFKLDDTLTITDENDIATSTASLEVLLRQGLVNVLEIQSRNSDPVINFIEGSYSNNYIVNANHSGSTKLGLYDSRLDYYFAIVTVVYY